VYRNEDLPGFDYTYRVPALLAQGTVTATGWLSASASGRVDAHNRYGTIGSPRVSLLAHSGHKFEARLSAGSGFAAPTPFTEETGAVQLARLVPPAGLAAERGRSVSLDLTGRAASLEVNGTLFASETDHAVLLRDVPEDPAGGVELVNAAGPTRTKGAELYAVYNHEPIIATANGAWLDATEISPETGARRAVPLTPTCTAALDVAWEEDESGTRVGLEVFYVGRQSLEHDPVRDESVPYATFGVLASQRIGRAVAWVNLDNLGDVRQTVWEPLVLPEAGPGGRATVDPWAPLEGRSVNAGVRVAF
jgi:iron complex outermembrane receptor protein